MDLGWPRGPPTNFRLAWERVCRSNRFRIHLISAASGLWMWHSLASPCWQWQRDNDEPEQQSSSFRWKPRFSQWKGSCHSMVVKIDSHCTPPASILRSCNISRQFSEFCKLPLLSLRRDLRLLGVPGVNVCKRKRTGGGGRRRVGCANDAADSDKWPPVLPPGLSLPLVSLVAHVE